MFRGARYANANCATHKRVTNCSGRDFITSCHSLSFWFDIENVESEAARKSLYLLIINFVFYRSRPEFLSSGHSACEHRNVMFW